MVVFVTCTYLHTSCQSIRVDVTHSSRSKVFIKELLRCIFNIMSSSMMGLSSIHAWYFRMKSTWTSFITSLSLVSINLHEDFGKCVKREKIWAIYILLWRWSIDMCLIQVYWEPIFKFNGKHSIVSIKLFIGSEVWKLIKCMHDKIMILKYLHGNQVTELFFIGRGDTMWHRKSKLQHYHYLNIIP